LIRGDVGTTIPRTEQDPTGEGTTTDAEARDPDDRIRLRRRRMTIPFGRRRLILTFAFATAPVRLWEAQLLQGASDSEVAHFAQGDGLDYERAAWEGMTLLYGGHRRP